jgi:hypothetical protein
MFSNRSGSDAWNLEVGDVIAIKYRASRENGNDGESAGQWIQAEIIEHETDRWPFARLADGQLTDVRPYMTWRGVAKTRCNKRADVQSTATLKHGTNSEAGPGARVAFLSVRPAW